LKENNANLVEKIKELEKKLAISNIKLEKVKFIYLYNIIFKR